MQVHALLLLALLFAQAPGAEPADAQGWFQLGVQRFDARDYRGALDAFQHARQMNYAQLGPLAMRTARAYAQLGEKEKAFQTLKSATDNGFANVDVLLSENDLIPLRSDPRWAQAVAATRANQRPCAAAPEFRQFDYWLGEWDVESGGQKIARSSIQLILEDCVIFENYQTIGRLYAGKSFSLWDAANKRWEQRYVDTTGAFHEWTGGLEGDHMVFTWTYERNGVKTMNRMSYLKEGPDKVRQRIDVSTDDGKTWSVGYDGLYVRRR